MLEPEVQPSYVSAIAAAEAPWCTGEEPDRLHDPVLGSKPCRRDIQRAWAVLGALRLLPVEERMEAMWMEPVVWSEAMRENRMVWAEIR